MRLRHLVVPLLVAAVTLPAGAATAKPAHPSRVVVHDPRHDVVRQEIGTDGASRRRAPARRTGDLVRLQVTHRAEDVVVRVRVRKVDRSGLSPLLVFRTPATRLAALADPTMDPQVYLFQTHQGGTVVCPGATATSHRRVVRVSIPRSCFGDPGWVRTRATVLTTGETSPRRDVTYQDSTPGRGTRTLGPKSGRAYAPEGAVVADVPPPIDPGGRVPAPARDLLRHLLRLG